jgi:hypothetical protein
MAHPLRTYGRRSANHLRECVKCDTSVRALRYNETKTVIKVMGTCDRFTHIWRLPTTPQDPSTLTHPYHRRGTQNLGEQDR